ncbi:hypothetical protein Ancab_023928 [Ancistrocladus abbreviatus]
MELPMGSRINNDDGSGHGVTNEGCDSRNVKRAYRRHTAEQVQRLEVFFKECPHPDDTQRHLLARELDLEPKQIKFWFQNKRTQTKSQIDREDNTTLRAENESIKCENTAIREALKTVACPSCGGPPFGKEQQLNMDKLQQENTKLRREHGKVSNLLATLMGTPIQQLSLFNGGLVGQGIGGPSLDLDLCGNLNAENPDLHHQIEIPETEKVVMAQVAVHALDELIKLLTVDEPLWMKSHTDGQYFLHQQSYEQISTSTMYFKYHRAWTESSKSSGLVAMNGRQLVDILLDSDKWVDIFPTFISNGTTIRVLEAGLLGNRSGSLQLINEKMHVVSALIPPREFFVLKYCWQIDTDVWVIVEISYDCFRDNPNISPSLFWKHPSGCMIEDLSNGLSKVTWVEHVEVDDHHIHQLYRDLVISGLAFGAQRWIITLQRMCERNAYFIEASIPKCEFDGVIMQPEGRKSTIMLACRMVKSFCSMLSMPDSSDIHQLPELTDIGVCLSVYQSTEPGRPSGVVISAASSLWLPAPPQSVFNYLMDHTMRPQWDVLAYGNPVHEITQISTGIHPGNRISVLQPFNPSEEMLILQESLVDPLGSMIIFAPMDAPSMNAAATGMDSSTIPILPSGFIISTDGHPVQVAAATTSTSAPRSGGSLLTVSFNILASTTSSAKDVSMETVATVKGLISCTVQNIKSALDPYKLN